MGERLTVVIQNHHAGCGRKLLYVSEQDPGKLRKRACNYLNGRGSGGRYRI